MNDEFMLQLTAKLSARARRQVESGGDVAVVFTRKQIEQAFIESFELVGGVPRLALWAQQEGNYGEFLKLLVKFAPKDVDNGDKARVVEWVSNVPQSPLNQQPGVQLIEEGVFEEVQDAGSEVVIEGVARADDGAPPGGAAREAPWVGGGG